MLPPARRIACLSLAACFGVGSASALPATERGCINRYLELRGHPEKSLQVLRECAADLPGSAVLQLTLGRRLLRDLAEGRVEEAARHEALAALERAAALEPAQVGEDWLTIADLHQQEGRSEQSLAALGQAEVYLPRAERERVQDRRWELALRLGDEATALDVWASIRFRLAGDAEAQLTAGRLLLAAGRDDEARRAFKTAAELQAGSAEAAAPLCRLLIGQTGNATAADRKLMLDTCEPIVDLLEPGDLEALVDAALRTFRLEQASELAARLLDLRPESAIAHFVVAEQRLRGLLEDRRWEERHAQLLEHARKSLRGELPEDREARAHAILGTALTYRALARYRSGGSAVSGPLLTRTKAAFLEALGHLGRAQTGGEPVAGEIGEVKATLRRLGTLDAELDQRELEARIEECESIGRQARRLYEVGRPLERRLGREVGLVATTDAADAIGVMASGTEVVVLDARWTGQECRCRVRAEDATTGWAPLAALDP